MCNYRLTLPAFKKIKIKKAANPGNLSVNLNSALIGSKGLLQNQQKKSDIFQRARWIFLLLSHPPSLKTMPPFMNLADDFGRLNWGQWDLFYSAPPKSRFSNVCRPPSAERRLVWESRQGTLSVKARRGGLHTSHTAHTPMTLYGFLTMD